MAELALSRMAGKARLRTIVATRFSPFLAFPSTSIPGAKCLWIQRRIVMAEYNRNSGTQWTEAEVRQLHQLAGENTPTRVIGLKLGRTPEAVQSKASEEGISLKPTNQSPYNRN